MESFHDQDYNMNNNSSTTHDQEVDQPKLENGVGRSYECVFCKRGFNTAQALGGHMNIHRKDRIRNRSISQSSIINSNNKYDQIQNHVGAATHLSYRTYFPAHSSASTTAPVLVHDNNNNRQCLNLFGDDWRVSLSLEFGAAGHVRETMEKNKGTEDDLDLELRLGHDP
ncbi:PREDICTED: transcriptional regulator SUPERMAN-like [Nicotiana attenuata]|uniref:C2H2-type domain-containing protein n=1 Tax=Nicotiana attenuata TaxID=49451 RepID=A0A1J6J690_NICAT|nr:PREDICTED: transcriptional regulator SUPERMAN-like [Nicotiana attenuata]OIT08176.1 hypothetical protein A4A49_11701 [Nicotiana attenuata]